MALVIYKSYYVKINKENQNIFTDQWHNIILKILIIINILIIQMVIKLIITQKIYVGHLHLKIIKTENLKTRNL